MLQVPEEHNLPVSLELPGYEGQIGHMCVTQPRQYCHPDGGCQLEHDHYVQLEQCPKVPVD